ncbi:MAG: hypothetical protein MMC33_001830 [Icmadophila ericetorum]|nr:hypothetical protein [Icmadophila ericetorum]
MRLPYSTPRSPPDAITQRLITRRHPRPLLSLDLTLLHAPPVADGWNTFLGSIRTQTSLSESIRELAICRVAVLNGAAYEWTHHVPLLERGLRSEGDGEGLDSVVRVVRDEEVYRRREMGGGDSSEKRPLGLSEKQQAVMDYTDQMTIGCKVDDEVFERVKSHFSEKEVVELTATVACYNCVSRFLVALDVGEMNGTIIGKGEGEKKEEKAAES